MRKEDRLHCMVVGLIILLSTLGLLKYLVMEQHDSFLVIQATLLAFEMLVFLVGGSYVVGYCVLLLLENRRG